MSIAMDAIVARIKAYVLIVNTTLTDDAFLDFMIEDVVQRAMIYMNRFNLVLQYEEDVVTYPITDKTLKTETYYEYWKAYRSIPIPSPLERPLASTVVSVFKTATNKNTADVGAVKSAEDKGQKVSYSEQIASYMNTAGDSEIFSGTTKLMDKFRLINSIGTT